ncbi:hypothetical protein BKA69DRAFT_1088239 [Paraphysoderma sedebokerense]|nr:hypothetical protein BKA69DRAFT_1088239 [Paraphysoderma sedebokerense]
MSGFSDLVNSGADCGPVNPLASFAKQFNQDNSLHHDRFAAGEGSSRMVCVSCSWTHLTL